MKQSMSTQGTVYLIHFDQKLAHAQHYVGFTTNLEQRLKHHRNGSGARLMEVIKNLGIPWQLARTWNAPKSFERQLKNRKCSGRYCPICQEQKRLEQEKQ